MCGRVPTAARRRWPTAACYARSITSSPCTGGAGGWCSIPMEQPPPSAQTGSGHSTATRHRRPRERRHAADSRRDVAPCACQALRVRRQNSQDQHSRLLEFYQTRPPLQQGVIICVLLGNALLVVTLDGVVVIAVTRGAIHSWRHRRLGPVSAMRTGIGPALCAAIAASAIQWIVAQGLLRAMDSGRAAAWLERSERWLTANADSPNEWS
jgi:hypothetical protein